MASRNYDMASNMENRNIQQALTRYDMRNNDYSQPDMFRYGTSPMVRTDRSQMAVNNRALERKIGGSMCGCAMSGGAVNSVLSEMDNNYDGYTNKNFTSPYKQPQQYIQNGQINFVPYYNMVEMAQINSRADADNVLRGRGIDYGKYANQAKKILGDKVKVQVGDIVKPALNQVKILMKDPDVKQLAQEAIDDPEVRRAVGKILNDAKDLARGGSIYSSLGSLGAKALTTGAKVGTTALKYGSKAVATGAKYGAVAVEVGSKYGAKGVAVASAVANNKAVQKVASDVADNPAVQAAVVGLISAQIAKLAPAPEEVVVEEEEEVEEPTGGAIRRRKRGGMISLNRLKEKAKEKIKERLKRRQNTTQQTLAQYEDDDDTFRIDDDEDDDFEEAKEKVKGAKKADLEMRDLSGSGVRRRKRKGGYIQDIFAFTDAQKAKNKKEREASADAWTKLTTMPKKKGGAVKGGKNQRALIVKKVMKEKGLGLIEASKYVKQHNLY